MPAGDLVTFGTNNERRAIKVRCGSCHKLVGAFRYQANEAFQLKVYGFDQTLRCLGDLDRTLHEMVAPDRRSLPIGWMFTCRCGFSGLIPGASSPVGPTVALALAAHRAEMREQTMTTFAQEAEENTTFPWSSGRWKPMPSVEPPAG